VGIVSQPQGGVVCPGEPVSLSVTLVGSQPWFFQWQKDGTNLMSGTNQNYAIPSVGTSDLGSYRLIASNALSMVTSAAAQLSYPTISLTSQPANATLWAHNNATSTVGVSADPGPLAVQWYQSSFSTR